MMHKKHPLGLLAATMLLFGFGNEAMATHFRGGYITWERVSGNTVKFIVQSAWRADAANSVFFAFGDGGSATVLGPQVAAGTDLAGNQYRAFRQEVTHTYPNPGPWTAGFSSCCRISNLANAPDASFLLQTTVNTAQQGGSVTSVPFILQVPRANNIIDIPVIDPDGVATCRLATVNEAGFGTYPAGFSISSNCKLNYNASSAAHGTKIAAQLIMEQGGLKTPYDFIVEVNGNVTNLAPVCQLNGSANSTAGINTPFSISATATDPEGIPLTVTHLGLPSGATLTPPSGTLGSSPLTATLNWTPIAVGQTAVSLVFTDNNNQNCQSSFTIDVNNAPPVADAGADASINEGTLYQLNGSGYDPDFDVLTYSWVQTGGPALPLIDVNTRTPSFTAPYVNTNQVLTFELTVSDGIFTAKDTVDITVVQSNHEPIADAGNNGSIKEGTTAHLDGSLSYDPDNEPVQTYKWTQVDGPVVSLMADNTVAPFFTAPGGTSGQIVVFRLEVSDGKELNTNEASLPDPNQAGDDLVSIKIVENSKPVANAGTDITKDEGNAVSLDGSASSDPDGDALTYQWLQMGGIPVTLDDVSSATPTFTAPWVSAGGDVLTFQLTVMDDDVYAPKSSMDEVVVNVKNANDPPSCNLAQPSIAAMWPPNHKMVPVAINNIADAQDVNWTLDITTITQDEPIDGTGDGDTSPDASIVDGTQDSVTLRSERAGGGNGRVYTVNFTANDGKESCSGSVKVTVPHDRKGTAIDDGQTVDSTQP